MVQATKTTTAKKRTATTTSNSQAAKAKTTTAKTVRSSNNELSPEELANKLRLAIKKSFKVTLAKREQRIAKKIYYACREKLGLDISSQIKPDKLDWKLWNKVFSAIFGEVNNPKFSVEQMALAMSLIYDTIPQNTSEAVEHLIELNRLSFEKRNNGNGKSEEEIDKLIDELEDEDEEEDEDDLEPVDEEEDEDFLDEEDEDDLELDDED